MAAAVVPKTEASANGESGTKASWDSDVMARMLNRADENAGMLLELPAGGSESGSGFAADEEGAAKLLLQRMDTRAHC